METFKRKIYKCSACGKTEWGTVWFLGRKCYCANCYISYLSKKRYFGVAAESLISK